MFYVLCFIKHNMKHAGFWRQFIAVIVDQLAIMLRARSFPRSIIMSRWLAASIRRSRNRIPAP